MTDLQILLKEYIEEGEEYFPALFRQIKPCLYFPLLKYRNFFPDGAYPDADSARADGFSDLFAVLLKRGAASKYDAIRDHLYGIWELIEKGKILEQYYYEHRDSAGIRNGLEKIAGNYIYGSITDREPEMSRIFTRMKKILENGPKFRIFPSEKEEWWGLSYWSDPDEFHRSMEEMRELISSIPAANRIKERPDAKKSSIVLSNSRMNGLMNRILEALKMTLTASLFIKAIGLKVPIIDAGFTSLDLPPGRDEKDEEGAGSRVFPRKRSPSPGMAEDAGYLYDSLTGRQQQVLRYYWMEEATLEETGAILGISKSLVANEKIAILGRLRKESWEIMEEFELFVEALRNIVLEKLCD